MDVTYVGKGSSILSYVSLLTILSILDGYYLTTDPLEARSYICNLHIATSIEDFGFEGL